MTHETVDAYVVPGHRVASGLNGDTRFPGGTLRMQMPHFAARGLNMAGLYSGTLNVSVAPLRYSVLNARHTFASVQWHPTEPAETFSFFDVELLRPGEQPIAGYIYYPHPETKPEHFQKPDVIELWLPFVPGSQYGSKVTLRIPKGQLTFQPMAPSERVAAGGG